ncbi:MAG TPA: asparagine synthase (glutamine-hydrolyzing) [Magnetovibrio sp.]
MCGFVGFIRTSDAWPLADAAVALATAADAIRHRGPDDGGTWVSADGGVGLGFRRLAIVDLTEHGHQPMASEDGRYLIAFNGEIYNFRDLRAQLDGERPHSWQGHSDTEVLLEMICRKGVEETLNRVDGMFAFALWDKAEETLTLARDRFGEKPLYYGMSDGAFVFGSELKALKALPGFRTNLDRDSLALFFRYRYIPGQRCIYQAYHKLEAGTFLTLKGGVEHMHRYWDPATEARTALANPFQGGREEALEEVSRLFQASVARRLESDVPLGAFLSGGIDSSLAVAYAQRASDRPVNTFTIGFPEKHFDEAPFAKAVAKHLGTNHTEIEVSQSDALELVGSLATMYDEPFADPSQLPTAVLCAKARAHVTVALAGDGGDELFCGYSRYVSQVRRWKQISGLSPAAKQRAELLGRNLPVAFLDALGSLRGKPGKLGRKWLTRLQDRSCEDPETFFMQASSFWRDGVPVQGVGRLERALFAPVSLALGAAADVQRFQILDTGMYLPDDVLVKTDRASMAASLEVRTPFLNADLARFAWSLPFEQMDPARHGLKAILKDLLARHLPREEFERPKQGFDAPIRQWLRGELKVWGEDLVFAPSALAMEHLDVARIQARWTAHQKGLNEEGDLWPALMMLAWMREN